jgi:hypothetical protein
MTDGSTTARRDDSPTSVRARRRRHAALDVPDGHPRRPLSDADMAAKVAGCVGPELAATVLALGWDDAAALLHGALPEGAAR